MVPRTHRAAPRLRSGDLPGAPPPALRPRPRAPGRGEALSSASLARSRRRAAQARGEGVPRPALAPPPPRSVPGPAGQPLPRRRAGARAPEAGGAAALARPGWERAGPALKGRIEATGSAGGGAGLGGRPVSLPSAPSTDPARGGSRPLSMRGAPLSEESPGQGAAPDNSAGGRGRRDCAQLGRPGPSPPRLEAGAAPKSPLGTVARTRAAPAGTPTRNPCAS